MSWNVKLCGNPAKVLAEVVADAQIPASVRMTIEDQIAEMPYSYDSVVVVGCGCLGLSHLLLVEPFNSVEAAPAPAPAPAPVTANTPALVPVETETPAEVIPVTAATTASASAPADEDEEPTKFSTEPCPVCKGTGSTIPGSGIPCEHCHGTGKVETIAF
jgi:hypothetical protein